MRLLIIITVLWLPALAWGQAFELRQGVPYVSRDGQALLADVYTPAGQDKRGTGWPAVIVIHGGGWVNGDRGEMKGVASYLAQHGFVAISIDYRLAPQARFPAQIYDCKAAVRWARSHAGDLGIDAQRIGAWGYSAGAHLALLLGTTGVDDGLEGGDFEVSSRVQAVVAGAGPTDLRGFDSSKLVRKLLGGHEPGREGLYRAASPLLHVSADDAPSFLYHGRHDWVVDYRQSVAMRQALQRAGVPAQLLTLPFGHVASFLFDGRALQAGTAFLQHYLEPGVP